MYHKSSGRKIKVYTFSFSTTSFSTKNRIKYIIGKAKTNKGKRKNNKQTT